MWQVAIFLLVSPIVVQSCDETMHICTMTSDARISTFNNETSAIYFPCTQILAEGNVPRPNPVKNFEFQITAITKEVHQARYASQIKTVALLIRLFTYENNEVVLRCGLCGCWKNGAPYQEVTNYVDQSLIVDITSDVPNGQTVVHVQEYGVEVRFRAEDGSVTILIPPDAEPHEQFPGLCNTPTFPVTFNAGMAAGLSLDYNDYIVFVNIVNINNFYETDPQCRRLYDTTCNPTQTLQRDSVKWCADVFVDQSVKECYYNYRNQNGSAVMWDFINCHQAICTTYPPYHFCNDVSAACGTDKVPIGAGCPPPPGK